MGFREIKERARRDLHQAMKVPAAFYVDPESTDAPILVGVRLRTQRNQTGDMSGTNLSYAQVQDEALRVLFFREEVPNPSRGALIVISATEGYLIDNAEAPDGLTVTVQVTRASASDLAGRMTPDDLT